MILSVPQDNDREIWYANRLIVLLHPLERFQAWAQQFREPGEGQEEFAAAIQRPLPFLVPLLEFEADTWTWLEEHHLLLFETALWSWSPERTRWPEDRSWEMFGEWFEIEILDAPWDVVAEPLHSNPPPAEASEWD
jgi:hypothetical protein